MQELIANVGAHARALASPGSLLQLVGIAVAIAIAWWFSRLANAHPALRSAASQPGLPGRTYEALSIVSPLLAAMLLTAAFGGFLHAFKAATGIVDLAITLIGLLLVIRLGVYVVRASTGSRTQDRGWGHSVALIIWAFAALNLLGWFDPVVEALDSVGLKAGEGRRITLWSVLKVLFTVSVFVLIAAWIARWIERRLMAMQGLAMSMRIGVAKFTQAVLIGLSLLIGLNVAGLDLTTLNVLTGAIGIGLGFGLQAIASNFVSGFVLLMDRSIKPGDVISFTGTTGTSTEGFGWVQELRGRYVVVRDRDGVETLVPNQHLITNPVINWSYTDPKVRLKLPVRVSYRDDVEQALALLLEAAQGHPRILREPAAPVSRLMGFADYGVDLELRFWIADPQEGVNNVRSDVNRAIWRLFREHGLTIPVAQREVLFEMKQPAGSDARTRPQSFGRS
jgi:small-conductance mechanosensitive channel